MKILLIKIEGRKDGLGLQVHNLIITNQIVVYKHI